MKLTLIGAGCGPDTLTCEAAAALQNADLVLGTRRLLELHQNVIPPARAEVCAPLPEPILARLKDAGAQRVCVLLSGDSGFYSAARRILPEAAALAEVEILPGISSAQLLSARLGRPWQDWILCSAHGVSCDILAQLKHGRPVFVLTSDSDGPAALCRALTEAGLGQLPVTVGEALGSAQERIVADTAKALASGQFHPLNVVLVEAPAAAARRAGGLPDAAFQRTEGVPMTKQEVRAAALAKLGVGEDDVCWDIGAGTGSVAIEMALLSRAVWAVERSAPALDALRRNRENHSAWNLRIVAGAAPEALCALPAPDKVFIGGSGGALREILQAAHAANPNAVICVSAIALETLEQAVSALEALGCETEITQIAVSRSKKAGSLHMMLAQNPVYLITGCRR